MLTWLLLSASHDWSDCQLAKPQHACSLATLVADRHGERLVGPGRPVWIRLHSISLLIKYTCSRSVEAVSWIIHSYTLAHVHHPPSTVQLYNSERRISTDRATHPATCFLDDSPAGRFQIRPGSRPREMSIWRRRAWWADVSWLRDRRRCWVLCRPAAAWVSGGRAVRSVDCESAV